MRPDAERAPRFSAPQTRKDDWEACCEELKALRAAEAPTGHGAAATWQRRAADSEYK
jgi:hypothetical protein